MTSTKVASWMTAKRLRAHGLILAICLWSVYLWNMAPPGLRDRAGNLKGTDFLHFYTLGSLALAHRGADLYDMRAQAELAAERVPAAAGIRYLPLYPPQVSIFFAPFARLSYPWALTLWLILSALLYGACCYFVWLACPGLCSRGPTVVVLALAYPAFWHLLAWGQTSALALACFTLAFFALRNQREFTGWSGFGMSHLQAAARLGHRNRLLAHTALEDHRWRACLRHYRVGDGLALLRPRPAARMDARLTQRSPGSASARAPALPNPLLTHLLDHAPPMALGFARRLPHERASGFCISRGLLAQQRFFVSPLFCSPARHGLARSASHRLRSRDPRARFSLALGLDHRSTQSPCSPGSQAPALFRLCAAVARPTGSLDTRSTVRPGDGRCFVWDVETREEFCS